MTASLFHVRPFSCHIRNRRPDPKRNAKCQFFAACAPGLEDLLFDELKSLHAGNAALDSAGVSFTGTFETMVRVNLQSRIAERILLRLGSFHADSFRTLEKETALLSFEQHITPNASVYVQATCKKSKIYHSGAAAERVARAIHQKIGLVKPPALQTAPSKSSAVVLIQVRIVQDTVTISIDTSGELLHRRGYRTHVSEAPMRETVAAAALRFCNYTGEISLADPMCGSGTFPIEAALTATRTAPGLHRSFAFEHWPSFDSQLLHREKERAIRFARSFNASIFGSDHLSSAMDSAKANAHSARMENHISFSEQTLFNVVLQSEPGLIIVNPPWGMRLHAEAEPYTSQICETPEANRMPAPAAFNGSALQQLYRQLGKLKQSNLAWELCLITSNPKLAHATGIPFKKISAPITMGGVRIKFYLG